MLFTVNKDDYLLKTEKRLKNILDNNTELRSYINQSFAKKIGAIFKERYSESYLWRYALFLSSKGAFLLENDPKDQIGAESLKTAAEIYENLYYTSKYYDKNYSLLLSSLCYDLSGYQANALCLIDKLMNSEMYYSVYDEESEVLVKYENKILKTIQLFLQKRIFLLSKEIESFELNLETSVRFHPNYGSFFEDYFNSIQSLCNFIFKGKDDDFLEEISESYKSSLHSGNVLLSHLIRLFKTRLNLLRNSNTWDILRGQVDTSNPVWNNYLKLLSMDIYNFDSIKPINERTSIFEFWKSQLAAINKGILSNEKNYIIQMPTSAGKTFIAELMILNALIKNPGSKCIYIAPFRALTTEIEETLSNKLGKLGFMVSNVSGNYEIDEYQLFWVKNADVLVATPEKIDLIYRSKPEFFENVSLVTVDEGHVIGNEGKRSSLLELLLIKLRRRGKNTRFLFISAVMSEKDAKNFSKWLSGDSNNVISSPQAYNKVWEPTRKLIGYYNWYKADFSGQILYPYEKMDNDKSLFLPYIIKQNEYHYINPETHRPNNKKFPANKNNRSETAVELAYKLIDDGNILIFTSKPKWTDSIGKAFLRLLDYKEKVNEPIKTFFKPRNNLESIEMAERWLGSENTVTKCLRRGIGIHCGPLSEPIRRSIEKDFREKRLSVLISTNTIGQGLNFPIKTAIIHSLEIDSRYDARVSIRDFWNIVGRAGRAGKETEGQIIFLNFNKNDEKLFIEYTHKENIEPVESQIFSLTKELIENRISMDDFNYVLKILIEPSLMNMLIEESVETIDEDFIKNTIDYSLFKIQIEDENYMLDVITNSMINIGRRFYSKIEDKQLREIYSKTGFYLSSCIEISNFIEKNIISLKEIIAVDDYKELLKYMMVVFLELPEMDSDKIEKFLIQENIKELYVFVSSWIDGIHITELNKLWSNTFLDTNILRKKMQLYISQFLEYRYPWGATVFLVILIYHLNKHFDKMPQKIEELPIKIRSLSSFIKYGFNEPLACIYKGMGIKTREACLELTNKYYGEEYHKRSYFEKEKLEEFIIWFSTIDPDYINDLNLSEYEIKNIWYIIQNLNFKKLKLNTKENLEGNITSVFDNDPKRAELFESIELGDILILERDFNHPPDIYSIKILYRENPLGFVSRDITQSLALEMDLNDKKFVAVVMDKHKIHNFYNIFFRIHEV